VGIIENFLYPYSINRDAMERNELIVSDSDTAEICSVVESVETAAATFAHVDGPTLSGWVEVPERPAEPKHVLLCEDCGREPTDVEDEVGPLRKENALNSPHAAEVLRDIHTALRPSHDPRIERRA